MTADEVGVFLARKRMAVVGTLDQSGAPDGEPASFAYARGRFTFAVARDGPTHRHLGADPRVVCSVEEFPSYAEIKGVAVLGRAALAGETGERVTFRVEAPRFESFDFSKLRR